MDRDYIWIKDVGLYREIKRQETLGCFLPTILTLLMLVGIWLSVGNWRLIWVPLLAAGLSTLLTRYSGHRFFNAIVCPHCTHNPTRRKSDGKPRKDISMVKSQIRNYKVCPNCGDERAGEKTASSAE